MPTWKCGGKLGKEKIGAENGGGQKPEPNRRIGILGDLVAWLYWMALIPVKGE